MRKHCDFINKIMPCLKSFTYEEQIFYLQSGKRKQDLLSEIVLEEQRSRELSKIVKEWLPDPKNDVIVDKPSKVRPRKVCFSLSLFQNAGKLLYFHCLCQI